MAQILMIEDKLTRFLESISVPEQFNENDGIEDNTKDIYWDYDCGASKAVLIVDELSEVVKIPFETSGYGDPFEYASCNGRYSSDWDYCNTEAEMYDVICEYGFEEFFVETKFWGYSKGSNHPLYTQEKVVTFYQGIENRTSTEKSKRIADKMYVPRLETEWVALAIDWYGEERVKALVDFLNSNDEGIGYDLHTGNVGFRMNGAPVILDYAGYNEEY